MVKKNKTKQEKKTKSKSKPRPKTAPKETKAFAKVKKTVSKIKSKTKIKVAKLIKKLSPRLKVKPKIKLKPKVKTRPKLQKKAKIVPQKLVAVSLSRSNRNPIMAPSRYSWESQGVFNPGAVEVGGRVHLFYRALGDDGVSRFGYASSEDGVNFDTRLTHPVYVAESYQEAQKHWPFTSPARLTYNTSIYASGGGWGGCEDPRAVLIDGVVYLTFNIFNGWNFMRVGVTSIKESDLLNRKWNWNNFTFLSRPGDRQKNWVLFPEKINGKFAIFHNLDMGDPNRVGITYMNELSTEEAPAGSSAPDPQVLPNHNVAWHFRTRSASAPPIKTKEGWLLLYHAMEKADSNKYKVGAMLLDLKDPSKVLYRSARPILEPDLWYENNWKPGIVYASGAIVRNGELYVYYGGGDKYIGLGTIKLAELLKSMKESKSITLTKTKIPIK